MSGEKAPLVRSGKELHEATRPFAKESRFRSWWCSGSTFALLALVLTGAGAAPWWPLRTLLSILGGLLLVRAFILYHDFMHGAILRKSRVAKFVFYLYGMAVLTPPQSWRHSHNFHHANVGKAIPVEEGEFSLLTSDIGAVPLMTTTMWEEASFWQRLRYRISRHPVTILSAYVTVFLFSITLVPLLNDPRKFWDGALSLLVHGGLVAALWSFAGFPVAFFAFLLPFAIAAASGAYLFFAQHNFEGLRILPSEEWSHFRAALESSSYMKLGPIMNWFTGNIGYHHVHHLNSLIPFYRLPEAMAAIPELQSPVVTTLRPRDIITCLRLSLWDVRSQRLVTYRTAAED
ncbi:MAG: fatty acid desaturase [Deltaproteobacteria bacterium]|nr:fatty acid desaturase [Deltaproteobacteria bacterium]